jgi:tetratricopeptide (TPR) repeat protein
MNLNKNEQYESFITWGDDFYRQKNYKNAIVMYNNAIQLNPGINDNLYYKRGCVFFNVDNYNSAIHDFTEAINLNHDQAKYYHRRGLAYFYDRQLREALEDLLTALELKPDDSNIEKHINDVCRKLGINPDTKPDQIKKDLNELEKKEEGDPLPEAIDNNYSLRRYMEPLVENIFCGFNGVNE